MNRRVCLLYGLLFTAFSPAQAGSKDTYWQQEISYKMVVSLDVQTNRLAGKQTIKYKNNSPETLEKVFFHLYFNAFQPGSTMDIQALNQPDADPRIGSRISGLRPEEIGYQRIIKLTQDGDEVQSTVTGTILEVSLAHPIRPGQSAKFQMEFEAQVPIQIRRSGRDNAEGIRYSMSQWYPKMCEFDKRGWHADPYIAREFYGVWGDFDVEITIDSAYTVAASGVFKEGKKATDHDMRTWRFQARKVHDFVWAADPDYIHDQHVCADGVVLHAFYQPHESYTQNWKELLPVMEEALRYINKTFGQYPYPVYSFIQGGDAGMEYPMATLITGHRSFFSLVGVSVHELMHSWYQMVLGFNESYYYWMDEGFTNYASQRVMEHLKSKRLIPGNPEPNPFATFYTGYKNLVEAGIEEPLCTHADLFETNAAYGIAAYSKGAIFLNQLEYVIGTEVFNKGLLEFYATWKFKHPDDNDFIRSMERVSDLELDWYKDFMINTTKTIDYAVDTLLGDDTKTIVGLRRDALMPMPVDIVVTRTNGSNLYYSIPLDIMRGAKKEYAIDGTVVEILEDWDWVNPYYVFIVPVPANQISKVSIDPTGRLADLNPANNTWPLPRS